MNTATTFNRTRRVWDATKKDYVTITVTISVDFDKIADDLAAKAYGNKSKVAKIVRGAVQVRHVA